jgi:hypothetical protein
VEVTELKEESLPFTPWSTPVFPAPPAPTVTV